LNYLDLIISRTRANIYAKFDPYTVSKCCSKEGGLDNEKKVGRNYFYTGENICEISNDNYKNLQLIKFMEALK
jgi:hypothetical protein